MVARLAKTVSAVSTRRHLLPLLVALCFADGFQQAVAQQVQRFDPKAYPSGSFRISRHEYPHGEVTVRIIQAKRVGAFSSEAPSYCRAWLEVRSDRLLKRVYYDDIEPLGFSYGIFVPKRQPLADFFLAVKEGDY